MTKKPAQIDLTSPAAAEIISTVMKHVGWGFGAANAITFIDSKRFTNAVEALAGAIGGDDPIAAGEKAEDLLLGVARVWPDSYREMIPEKRRVRVITSIMAEVERERAAA